MIGFAPSKRIGVIAGGIVLLLIVADIALHLLVNGATLRPTLEKTLGHALGREVKIADLRLAIFSGGVEATDLTIADDPAFSRRPFVQAQSVKVNVELAPLIFSHALRVKGLTVENPQIVLIEGSHGTWNYSSLGNGASAAPKLPPQAPEATPLQIGSVRVSGGRVTVTSNPDTPAAPMILEQVKVETKGFSRTSAVPFSLSATLAAGGSMQLTGTFGPLNPSDTAATPAQATLQITHLDLAKSGLINPAVGIGGIASLDAKISQRGDDVRLDGALKAGQWRVARNGSPAKNPLEFDFTIDHNRRQQAGSLTRGDLHLGSAVAHLTGRYDLHGEIPDIDLTLAGPNFAGSEVGAALPAFNVVLPAGASLNGGTVSVNLRAAGPVTALTTSGTIGVANARLANFDLGSKLQALQSLSGIKTSPQTEIRTLQANVQSTPASTRLDAIQLVVPSVGDITGAGTISASHALDFRMRLAVTGAVGLIPALGKVGTIPFAIQGTSQDPKFIPDVGALATEKIKGLTGNNSAATSVINGILGRKR